MGKGRSKKSIWMTEKEVVSFLGIFIDREIEILNVANKTFVCVKVRLKYSGLLEDYDLTNPYNAIGAFLEDEEVENNLKDFAEALTTNAYDSLLKHIKIERHGVFTDLMDNNKIGLLCKFILHSLQCEAYAECGGYMLCYNRFFINKVKNQRQLAYLFHLLEQRGFVHSKWQHVIERRGIMSTERGKFLNAKDLNSALQEAKETANSCLVYGKKNRAKQEYEMIKDFVYSL